MKRKGITDFELAFILEKVELSYLLERESFDSINDWTEVLSGGEKQRVAIARVIYHKPQYAILDECTSAVAVDVEQRIYKYLIEEIKCSLLSVTHRVKQLQHFHQCVLRYVPFSSFSEDFALSTLSLSLFLLCSLSLTLFYLCYFLHSLPSLIAYFFYSS